MKTYAADVPLHEYNTQFNIEMSLKRYRVTIVNENDRHANVVEPSVTQHV